ncbi:MAG: lipopolysaccharide biosynthesis protein [Acutalibacteraceae bacterium]
MQQNANSKFLRNSVLFLVGSVFSKLLSFILLPLYTTYIPTADFGVYDIATLYVSLISGVVYFEIWSAMLRYLYDFDASGKMTVIKSSLQIFAVSTAIFILVSLGVCKIVGIDYIPLVVGWGIVTAISTYMGFLARGLGKNIDFAVSGILNTATCLGINILLIMVLKMNYSALYIGSISGMLLQSLYLLLRIGVIKDVAKAKSDRALTKEIFKYAFPLCINTTAYWVLHSSARVIYNALCGDSQSGIFSVGNKFGTIIVLATTCFTYAWQDMSFSASSENKGTKLYSAASKKYLLFLSSCLCVALPVLRVLFPFLVKGDYTEAINYVPLFLIVAVASGYSAFIGNIFYAIKSTKVISVSTLISGAVTVGLAVPLIKLLGANGANLAVLTGFAVNIIIRFFILKKKTSFQIPLKELLFIGIWICVTTLIYTVSTTVISILLFAINIVIMALVFKKDLMVFIKQFDIKKILKTGK